MADREDIRKQMKKAGIEFLLAQFVDLHGSAKVKMVPASSLDAVIDDGAGFAGAAVWGVGQGPHSHDMLARIDLDSYTPLPWMPNTARFAADLYVDGESYPYCPRTNLKRVLDSVRDKGYVFNVGMEPEHFLVTRNPDGSISPWDPDGVENLAKPCYDFRSMAPAMEYLQELTSSLNELGWGVYQTDHEDANGQYEVNFDYADALTTADRITFFKMATSQIAKKYGAIATHMPKPFADRTGSGLHVHFHLADADSGECLFDDDSDSRGLGCSELGYHFVGGVLRHARALCAVTSPTVNCYKRLKLGAGLHSTRSGFTWTPAFVTYGDNNRTQMIRTAGPGHFEDRTVSAGCNPYLALAAYVAAGIDGIENKIDPGDPNLGNMYEKPLGEILESGTKILPQSLFEAVEELRDDEIIKDALGVIADEFIELKIREWETYAGEVSQWEIDEYLTFF
ncbi:MAG: type III glutamate--ammonia ligase [Planctomycetota bacterium]|nr:MAG: type III glutamate--ammonia ligase [Planctomycetota bacterium]REJ96675.1 MAG: type III glutamate--ammonia ligase [Planctomycetota bacterium]REK23822.1 MAG: type III glutamate--ammonia ligase [Planctomycetota bacterium]REK32878.1 MAG: type III glutamate--ammonia ligase [Planctomycetota bacterium]